MTDHAFEDMHALALSMANQLNAFASQVKDQSDRVDYLKEQLAIETPTKSASTTVGDNESAALSESALGESADAQQQATAPPTAVDSESSDVQQQATADATLNLDQAPVNPVDLQADQTTESNIQKARKTLFAVSKPTHVRSVAWDVNMVQANKPLKMAIKLSW